MDLTSFNDLFLERMSSEFVFSAQGESSLQHSKKPPDPQKAKLSFRDKLLGSANEIPTR